MEKKIFFPEFRSALLILLNLDVVVSQVSAFKKGVKRRGVIVDAYLVSLRTKLLTHRATLFPASELNYDFDH